MSKPYRDQACAEIIRVLNQHYEPFGLEGIDCTRQESTGKLYICIGQRGRMEMFELASEEYRAGWEIPVTERIDNWLTAVSDRAVDERA